MNLCCVGTKEDFASGTAAALAGGVTLVCAMPNTNPRGANVSDSGNLGVLNTFFLNHSKLVSILLVFVI